MDNAYIKQRTLELYDMLPQNKQERMARHDIRDEIFELNYKFFGYIASHKFINNSAITYEDKFQSACLHFMECWWWYKWKGDETHKGYRQDLAFSVFFKPRITEMMERELDDVKYSLRRSLCMEVGDQIGKHWGQVKYEDLSDPRVHVTPAKMTALQAIFGTLYEANLEDHETYLRSYIDTSEPIELTDEYNTVEELLIHEMIEEEEKITPAKLKKMADMYGIDIAELKEKLPKAEKMLYDRLQERMLE